MDPKQSHLWSVFHTLMAPFPANLGRNFWAAWLPLHLGFHRENHTNSNLLNLLNYYCLMGFPHISKSKSFNLFIYPCLLVSPRCWKGLIHPSDPGSHGHAQRCWAPLAHAPKGATRLFHLLATLRPPDGGRPRADTSATSWVEHRVEPPEPVHHLLRIPQLPQGPVALPLQHRPFYAS